MMTVGIDGTMWGQNMRTEIILIIMQCVQGKKKYVHEYEDFTCKGIRFEERERAAKQLDQCKLFQRRESTDSMWFVWDYVGLGHDQ